MNTFQMPLLFVLFIGGVLADQPFISFNYKSLMDEWDGKLENSLKEVQQTKQRSMVNAQRDLTPILTALTAVNTGIALASHPAVVDKAQTVWQHYLSPAANYAGSTMSSWFHWLTGKGHSVASAVQSAAPQLAPALAPVLATVSPSLANVVNAAPALVNAVAQHVNH